MPAIIAGMDAGAVIIVGLCLFAFLGLWAKYGAKAAVVTFMIAGALIAYMFYAGVFNTTK